MMFLLIQVALADCPPIQPALDAARDQILYEQLPEAKASLETAQQTFACAPIFPTDLARYWLLNGALQQLSGNPERATPYYAASRRLVPEPDLQLGPQLVDAFKVADTPLTAQISLDPAIPAWVDGKLESNWPLTVAVGPHLVQVRAEDDRVLWNSDLDLADGQLAMLQTHLPAGLGVKKLPFPVYLVSGVLIAAGGGALAWGAMQQDPIIESTYKSCDKNPDNCDEAGFHAAGLRGDLMSIGAYTAWTVGAAGIVAQFVLPVNKLGWHRPKLKAPVPPDPADPPPVNAGAVPTSSP